MCDWCVHEGYIIFFYLFQFCTGMWVIWVFALLVYLCASLSQCTFFWYACAWLGEGGVWGRHSMCRVSSGEDPVPGWGAGDPHHDWGQADQQVLQTPDRHTGIEAQGLSVQTCFFQSQAYFRRGQGAGLVYRYRGLVQFLLLVHRQRAYAAKISWGKNAIHFPCML